MMGLGLLPVVTAIGVRADTPSVNAAAPAGYHLVWSDEFSKDPAGLPDRSKWSCEVGLLRNHEMQYYTKDRLENARVENGFLVIEGRKEDYSPPGADPTARPVAPYTSASLKTRGKAEWRYGCIEVCAKLPRGQGVWPAIWTLGISHDDPSIGWPKCGEIDIMEFLGKKPGLIYGTVHYFAHGEHVSQQGKRHLDHPEDDFHVYAEKWTPDRIDFFIDGHAYFSFNVNQADNDGQNPFRKPHYLILNLALGGSAGGKIDDSIFPQRMSVAYVRVYQKNPP